MSRSAERASPPHVLVVDDDEELCELLTLRLEHHGFRVTTEHNRRGALEAFERGVVDTVLLDLMLGDDNG
ncbi:MAG: response regulator, partial [Polyangiaceae bacterium]